MAVLVDVMDDGGRSELGVVGQLDRLNHVPGGDKRGGDHHPHILILLLSAVIIAPSPMSETSKFD